jgi:4-amino-4-deoxy-L-arabinose transferase-like glycosyltransferase
VGDLAAGRRNLSDCTVFKYYCRADDGTKGELTFNYLCPLFVWCLMRRDYLIISGLAFLFFFPFLGGVHLFDREEIYLAECAREMLLTGEWIRPQIDFQPFYERPPLFLWAQAVSMYFFGVNEFAARLPNAICGLITLLVVYRIGSRLHDRMFAWLWVLAWLGSFLPHFYFRSGIIDPWFNLLVFAGLYGFIEFRWQFLSGDQHRSFWKRYRYLIFGGGLLGMAVMTKGFGAYLVSILVLGLYWARYRFQGKAYLAHLALFSSVAFVWVGGWIGLDALLHGVHCIGRFMADQIRYFSFPAGGDGGFVGEHAIILLLGCFPVSIFALPNMWGDRQSPDELMESDTLAACKRSDLVTWMQMLFWVSFLLFGLARTNILHYSSLCYFPLTYLGAVTIWRAIRWDALPRIVGVLLPVTGVLLGLAVMVTPYYLSLNGGFVKILLPAIPLLLRVWKPITAGPYGRVCPG